MKNKFYAAILATIISVAPAVTCSAATPDPNVTLASQRYAANSTKVQHYSAYINLEPGEQKMPLTLTYQNGSDKAPSFTHLRIASPNGSYLSEKNFNANQTLSVDLSNAVSWGTNQILISGDGPWGTTLYWTLTTPRPVATAIDPPEALPGQEIFIRGTNLPSDAAVANVQINGATVPVSSASPTSLKVTVPEKTAAGNTSVHVFVNGIEAGALKLKVKGWPVITGLSSSVVAAGQPLFIYGQNFSSDPAAISVTIGSYPAPVLRATDTELTIQGPARFAPSYFAGYPDWYLPITVRVNGVQARNKVSLNVVIDL